MVRGSHERLPTGFLRSEGSLSSRSSLLNNNRLIILTFTRLAGGEKKKWWAKRRLPNTSLYDIKVGNYNDTNVEVDLEVLHLIPSTVLAISNGSLTFTSFKKKTIPILRLVHIGTKVSSRLWKWWCLKQGDPRTPNLFNCDQVFKRLQSHDQDL